MKTLRSIRKIKNNEIGFTLVEILIAVAIVGIIGVGIAVGMSQTFSSHNLNVNLNEAINNVRYAGEWMSKDIRGGNSINPSTATTLIPGNANKIVISWFDINSNPYTVIYEVLSDGSLQRTYCVDDISIVARSISSIQYSISDSIVTLNVTATVKDKSNNKIYEIAIRNPTMP